MRCALHGKIDVIVHTSFTRFSGATTAVIVASLAPTGALVDLALHISLVVVMEAPISVVSVFRYSKFALILNFDLQSR